MMTRQVIPCDAIIFDIDNVLIDTRRSYLDAIRWTVEIYLTADNIPLFTKDLQPNDNTVLTAEDIDQFKLLGGFNDDWDCCYGLLVYLLSRPVSRRTTSELKKHVDIKKFSRETQLRPLGVPRITALLGRNTAVTIEKIRRIFQEIYLGQNLFKALERKNPFYWKKLGLIRRETLIFKKRLLAKLKKAGYALGIATGRSRFEAEFALQHFGVLEYFDAITSSDEVKKAEAEARQSLRKPHPYSVLQTAKKMGENKSFIYVGDLPDDVLAANEAKKSIRIHSVVFTALSVNPEAIVEIQQAKPDFLIKKPSDLLTLLKVV